MHGTVYARPTLCPTLIGREREMTVVGQAIESAHNGLGSSIVLLGEAGVGKSRLARESRSLGQQRRMLALWGRCVDGGQSAPYRPFSEALLAAMRGQAAPEVDALRPFKPMLGQFIPHLRDEAADVAESSVVLAGEAVLRLLRVLAGDRGTILVIEDLHWADPETLALIDYLSANLAAEPLLLLGTLRSGEPGPARSMATSLHSRRLAEVLEVPRLSQTEMSLMARACLGHIELPTAVEAALASSAEGLPLLVEDLLAEWTAAGQLSGAGNSWHAPENLLHMVPLTFAEIIRRRLAALGQDATALLRQAALLGRSFDWRILPSATGLDDDQALGVLQRATQMQLIEIESAEGQAGFRFRHALTQAAILAELLPAQRARLAARLLELIQLVHAGLPGQWCDLAARLAAEAGATDQAAELLRESGRRALSSGALTTAEATLNHARTFCQPGSLLAADVEEKLMEALALAGKHEQVVAAGPELLETLARLNASAERLVRAHLRIARAFVAASNWRAAAEQLGVARHLAEVEANPAALLPRIDALAAHVTLGQGQTESAADLAEAALAGAERANLWEVACEALEVTGRAARQHDLGAAEAAFDRARHIAEEHGLAIWRLRAIHELGTIDIFTPGAGPERLLQARDLAERAGALGIAAIVDVQLAAMHSALGDFDAVLALAARSAEMAQRLGLSATRAVALLFAAEARGRMGPDRPAMEAALDLAVQAAKSDAVVELETQAMAWGDCRAMASLIDGNKSGALRELGKAQEYFRIAQSSAPSPSRGLWALLATLDSESSDSGMDACEEVAASSAMVQLVNRAYLNYADAVRAGRQGLADAAAEMMSAGDELLAVSLPWFLHFGQWLVAEEAIAQGWGESPRWLQEAAAFFEGLGQQRLASTCRSLLRKCGVTSKRSHRRHPSVPPAFRARGVTGREMEVLSVIGDGLSNREIGVRLYVSPKTVEKHISSLMDKLEVRTRAQLAAMASSGAALN
jgi:DNA-binding CsgD family transcriptional regulator